MLELQWKNLIMNAFVWFRRRRLHRRKYISKGPNYTWHIDSHNKLKPFGFSVHDCIAGFSRNLIWLKVGSSPLSVFSNISFFLFALALWYFVTFHENLIAHILAKCDRILWVIDPARLNTHFQKILIFGQIPIKWKSL